jgi:hypothetical protein
MVIFSLNNQYEIGMRNMGVVEIRVEAIPILAYLMATRESQTPRKGPKKDPAPRV